MSERLMFLEPVDVWSFRDGRPFDAGEVFEAASIFPPTPWTVLGSLRTALLRRICPDPERYAKRSTRKAESCVVCGDGPCEAIGLVGPPDDPPPFCLTAPLPGRKGADDRIVRFFPTPADLAILDVEDSAEMDDREHRQQACVRLTPMELPPEVRTSTGNLRPVGAIGPGRATAYPTGWLTQDELERYLAGQPELPDWRIARPDEWNADSHGEEAGVGALASDRPGPRRPPPARVAEVRIGIGMDYHENTVRTGRFYVREAARLAEGVELTSDGTPAAAGGWWTFGLTVTADRDLGLQGETVRLGGDGHLARLIETEAPAWPAGSTGNRRFRLYLAAPSFLSGGHVPGFLDPKSLVGSWPGARLTVRLQGVALGPPAVVGGWNLARQEPRPIRRLVGAGSVFYFELIDGSEVDVLRAAHGCPFCDDQAMARAGFGLAFVGEW